LGEYFPWTGAEQSLQVIRSTDGAKIKRASENDKSSHFETLINFHIKLIIQGICIKSIGRQKIKLGILIVVDMFTTFLGDHVPIP